MHHPQNLNPRGFDYKPISQTEQLLATTHFIFCVSLLSIVLTQMQTIPHETAV